MRSYLEEEARREVEGVCDGHHLEQEAGGAAHVAVPPEDGDGQDVAGDTEDAQDDDNVHVHDHLELHVQVAAVVNQCRSVSHAADW